MESGLAVRRFVILGRIIDISVGIEVINNLSKEPMVRIFREKALLGLGDQLFDSFLFLFEIVVQR